MSARQPSGLSVLVPDPCERVLARRLVFVSGPGVLHREVGQFVLGLRLHRHVAGMASAHADHCGAHTRPAIAGSGIERFMVQKGWS